jgi:Autotransporter beta-domain
MKSGHDRQIAAGREKPRGMQRAIFAASVGAALLTFSALGTSPASAQAITTTTTTGGITTTTVVTVTTFQITQTSGSCSATASGPIGSSGALSSQVATQLSACLAAAASSGGGSGVVTVRGTLPSQYIATLQQYFAVSQLGRSAQNTTQVSIGAVHTVTTEIRDSIMSRRPRGGPMTFTWDPYADNNPVDAKNDPFAKFAAYGDSVPGALGYAKSPIYTKAAPALPSAVQFAIWGQGFADQEKRTETFLGTDVGRTTTTYGGLAGFDAAFSNWLGFGGTYVVGALGGYTESRVRNADGTSSRVTGPGAGIYSVYAKGGWSIDTVSKVDFFNIDRWQTGLPTLSMGLTNYTSAGNINYRFDLANNWWVEPTAGISYTSTRWDNPSKILGMQDGETFRVQGGSRVGTSTVWGSTTVEGSVTGLAYSDVAINGGSLAVAVGAPLVPTDQGKVFGQGIGKLNFIWTPQISSYVEGEVRGRDGVIGYAGRVGARYSFQ